MGQQVQGKVLYGSALADGGGGAVAGARDGLSLDTSGFAVLGNLTTDSTAPAKLTEARRIPMQGFPVEWEFDSDEADNITINGPDARFNYISAEPQAWTIWQPDNYGVSYTGFGTAGRWLAGYDEYPGVNEPTTDRPNVVGMLWGYNTNNQQARIIAGEAAFRYATETFFCIGPTPNFEFHTPEITTTAGDIFRLDSTYVERDSGIGFREIVMDEILFFSQGFNPSGGLAYMEIAYNSASDLSGLSIRAQNPGGVSALSLQNNGEAGGASLTWQDGELAISSNSFIDLRAVRVVCDSTDYVNIVGPFGGVVSDTALDSPAGDAILTVISTTLGFRPPSMSTAQKNAIPAGPGLLVFDTDLNKLCVFGAAAWETVTSV